MPVIMPQNELVRRAAAWICAELAAYEQAAEPQQKPLGSLLDEAGMRFNLSPKDHHMLTELFSRSGSTCPQENAGRPD